MAIEVALVAANQGVVRQEVHVVGMAPELISELTLVLPPGEEGQLLRYDGEVWTAATVLELPEPPAEGTWVLKAVGGELSWVEEV